MKARDFDVTFQPMLVGQHMSKSKYVKRSAALQSRIDDVMDENPQGFLNDYYVANRKLVYSANHFFGDIRGKYFALSRAMVGGFEYGIRYTEKEVEEDKKKFISRLEEILSLVKDGKAEFENHTYYIFHEGVINQFINLANEIKVEEIKLLREKSKDKEEFYMQFRGYLKSRLGKIDKYYEKLTSAYEHLFSPKFNMVSDENAVKRERERIRSMIKQLKGK